MWLLVYGFEGNCKKNKILIKPKYILERILSGRLKTNGRVFDDAIKL